MGVHDRSGFSVSLAEGLAGGSIVQDAVDAFLELAEPVAKLVRGGANAEAATQVPPDGRYR